MQSGCRLHRFLQACLRDVLVFQAGGAGVAPGALHALAAVLGDGRLPPVRRIGAIGTGDREPPGA